MLLLFMRVEVEMYIIVNMVVSYVINLHRQYGYFLVEVNVHECICGCYCKYRNEFCYKALVNDIISMFLEGCDYKYYNKLCYKAPWAICFLSRSFTEV